jgi:hypothetical protein
LVDSLIGLGTKVLQQCDRLMPSDTPSRAPARPPKPLPAKVIVYSPSAKTLAAIKRWERLTGGG